MRRIFWGSLGGLALLSSAVFADPPPAWKALPYIGLKGGFLAQGDQFKSYASPPQTGITAYQERTIGGASVQGVGHVAVGCAWQSCWYLAADVDGGGQFGNMSVHTATDASGEENFKANMSHPFDFGATFRLGYTFWGAVPFLGLGLAYGQWKLKVSNPSSTAFQGVDPYSSFTMSKSTVVFKPGIGVLFKLAPCWDGLIEYNYFWGPTLSGTTIDSTPQTWTYNTKIRQHSVQIGFMYRFKKTGG